MATDPSEAFQAQQQTIQAALVAVNRTVNSIAAEDLTFLRTVNPAVAAELDEQAARLLSISNGLLASAAGATGRRPPPALDDADDVELHWRGVVDVIDGLLEKTDTTLDEYTGLLKRKDAPTTEGGPESKKPKQTPDRLDWSIRRANIAKPQEQFERKPDNFAPAPWKPLLTRKPHATVPLAASLTTFVDENRRLQFRHPYEAEITQLRYPDAVYAAREPVRYTPVETTSAIWVDTWEGVEAMLAQLRAADEIAVDLEHHDYRTYTGLLSLMQISTRTQDWIVDTLQPWRHRLEILNEVFCDPAKLKVFHGASSDIVWLQRDLGLYIVGLFDTYFACDCLEYSKRSLAFLLERFVQFDADKKYQMADWRIRPLPEEMLYYARSDTHYLLYIYDMVRNELAEKSDRSRPDKDLTAYVLQKSKEVSLLRHEALVCDPETGQGARGWLNNLVRTYTSMSGEQFAVYRALFQWRDDLARRLDESPGFIMPNRVLSDIARILPPDRKALWSLLMNTARVTKAAMDELFVLIQDAKARGALGPTSTEFLRATTAATTAAGAGAGGSQRHVPYSVTAAAMRAGAFTGPTTTALAAAPPPPPLPDVSELRSTFSQLWGKAPIGGSKKRVDAVSSSGGSGGGGGDDDTGGGGVPIEAPWFVQAAIAGSAAAPAASTPPPAAPTAAPAAVKAAPTEEYITLLPSAQTTPAAPKLRAGDAAPAPKAAPEPAADAAADGEKDEVFTLKWGKKTGNRKAADGSSSSNSNSNSSSNAAAAAAQTKKQRKKEERKERKDKEKQARKESKAAKRAARQSKTDSSGSGAGGATGEEAGTTQTSDSDGGGAPLGSGGDEEAAEDSAGGGDKTGDDDFVPFNYDTAGSGLYPKATAPADGKGGGSAGRKGKGGGKGFNPYGGKGDDGPKAARRMHFEKMGKSATFKK